MKYLIAIIAMILVGCSVYPDDWAKAEKACAENGGVERVERVFPASIYGVYCKNKAVFQSGDLKEPTQ